MKKPRIKFNGGNPVTLCNECSKILSYVKYDEDRTEFINVDETKPQSYCESCLTLKEKKSAITKAKAIIKSCETHEQLDIANSFLMNFLNIYKDEETYVKLLEKQKKKYEALKKTE
jgi:hypothetical protein